MIESHSFPCDEYSGLSRRGFLAAGTAGIAALASLPAWLPRVARASSQNSAARDVVVQVYLRGGMDGLSAVVPYNETNYAAARPALHVLGPGAGDNNCIDLLDRNTALSPTAPGGVTVFGLAKALGALGPLNGNLYNAYSDRKVLLLQGCGLSGTSKSHFDAQKWMETGRVNDLTLFSGWLGRHLASQTAPINPAHPASSVRALSITDGLPQTLVGSPSAIAIPDLQSDPGSPPLLNTFSTYGLEGADLTAALRTSKVGAMYAGITDPLRSAARNAIDTVALLNQIGAGGYLPTIPAGYMPAAYPAKPIGWALRSTAALIAADVGVEAVAIDYGGWDTHSMEGGPAGIIPPPSPNSLNNGSLYTTMKDLGDALGAFYADLIVGKGRNVTVVVMSEFGRRVGENSSLGTDHGGGNAALVLGTAVNGGTVMTRGATGAGSWSGIAPPTSQQGTYANTDLPITLDIRDVLAELVSSRLGNGANLGTVFPGYAPAFHGVFG